MFKWLKRKIGNYKYDKFLKEVSDLSGMYKKQERNNDDKR